MREHNQEAQVAGPSAAGQSSQQIDPKQVHIARRLAELWQRQRPELAARVEVLERAAAAASNASLTPELRAEAAALAHKLAGSLGLYGHASAGEAARKMEQLLAASAPLSGPELQGCATELRRVVQR